MGEFSQDLKEHVAIERKFLHDLSNMLLISQGMGGIVRKKMADIPDLDDKLLERLDKSLGAMERMVDAIKSHRTILHDINSD